VKIAVLLSGGIDSTVAGHLLKEQGHQVIGMTMINWDDQVSLKAAEAARCLGIEHRVVDLRRAFADQVIDYFCSAYQQGLTPNPCVECNRSIKFGALLDIANEIGCDMIATGHYARVEFDSLNQKYRLRKGTDRRKDQSYFLYALNQAQLAKVVFPLGEWTKDHVKKFGLELGLPMAVSKESQEICFIASDYREFLQGRVKTEPGNIEDQSGHIVGRHQGLAYYTIGQRKGLGVNGGRPLYVTYLDQQHNVLKVGDNQELFQKTLLAHHNTFISGEFPRSTRVTAKIRYAAQPAEAVIRLEGDQVRVDFVEAQRAITSGQSVVYYDNDYVVGGGTIC
jgi:tRNA-specific 2-thiouridylase